MLHKKLNHLTMAIGLVWGMSAVSGIASAETYSISELNQLLSSASGDTVTISDGTGNVLDTVTNTNTIDNDGPLCGNGKNLVINGEQARFIVGDNNWPAINFQILNLKSLTITGTKEYNLWLRSTGSTMQIGGEGGYLSSLNFSSGIK